MGAGGILRRAVGLPFCRLPHGLAQESLAQQVPPSGQAAPTPWVQFTSTASRGARKLLTVAPKMPVPRWAPATGPAGGRESVMPLTDPNSVSFCQLLRYAGPSGHRNRGRQCIAERSRWVLLSGALAERIALAFFV